MKLVMDEKLKHRLIGLAVIISLGAIFAPAVMKKSSQTLENNYSVNIKLPPKPSVPDVVSSNKEDVFKTIKVAKVKLPSVSEESQLPALAKAEPIQPEMIDEAKAVALTRAEPVAKKEPVQLAMNTAARTTVKKAVTVAAVKPKKAAPVIVARNKAIVKPAAKPVKAVQLAKVRNTPVNKKDMYAVQLASFSQLANAQSLVNRLHTKGYKANFIKIAGKSGPVYKVFVGHSPRKLDVVKVKTQLASAMQLNGFIVNTGVS